MAVLNLNLMLDPPCDWIAAGRAANHPLRNAIAMKNMPARQLGYHLIVRERVETDDAFVLIKCNPVGLIRNFAEGRNCHIRKIYRITASDLGR